MPSACRESLTLCAADERELPHGLTQKVDLLGLNAANDVHNQPHAASSSKHLSTGNDGDLRTAVEVSICLSAQKMH